MNNLEEISDLGLIAALVSLGHSPRERRREGKRIIFIFDWSEDMEALKDDYFNHRLMGDLNTFNSSLKSVKSSIYQMDNQ